MKLPQILHIHKNRNALLVVKKLSKQNTGERYTCVKRASSFLLFSFPFRFDRFSFVLFFDTQRYDSHGLDSQHVHIQPV